MIWIRVQEVFAKNVHIESVNLKDERYILAAVNRHHEY